MKKTAYYNHKPFAAQELEYLWRFWKPWYHDEKLQIPLILIYTGLRPGELLELRSEDVHLKERWLYVRHSKTNSGIRKVPISEKIVPFVKHWLRKKSEYFLCTQDGRPYTVQRFQVSCWDPMMQAFGMEHQPTDARRTCIALMAAAGVDSWLSFKIIGRPVLDAGETQDNFPLLLEAINKI